MDVEPGSIEHLTQLISHVVAPAFLLGAVGSLISLLSDRLMGVVHRIRTATAQQESHPGADSTRVPHLRHRAALLNIAVMMAVLSGIFAITLIIAAFAAALVNVHHVWIAAVLFILSAICLLASLITFGIDVKLGLSGHDLH